MYKKNDALKRFAAFVMALLMIFNMADFVPEIAIAIAEGEVIPEQQETPPVDAGNSAEAPAPAAEDPVPAPVADGAPAAEDPAPAPAADGAPAAEDPAPAPAADGAPAAENPAPAPAADGAPAAENPAPAPAADGAPAAEDPAPAPAADGAPAAEDPAPAPAAEDAPAADGAPATDGTPSSDKPAPEAPTADSDEAGKESAPAAETPVTPVMESAPVKEDPAVEIDPVEKESASDEGKQNEETPAENETESDGEDEQEEVPAEKESALDKENKREETPAVKETESDKEDEQEEVPAEKESALDEESNQEETPVVKETESDKEDEQEEVPAEKESELDEENNQEETPVVKETESDKEDEQEEVPAEKESELDEESNQEETPVVKETESDKEDEQEEVPAEKESELDEENQQKETPAVDETESDEEDQQKETTAENESELENENKQDETTAKDVTKSEEAGQQDDNSVAEETLTADAADKEIDPKTVTTEAAPETPVADETLQTAKEDKSAEQGIRPVINTELAAAPAVPTVKAAVPETPVKDTEGLLIITSNTSETQAETQTINKEETAVEITAETETETVPAAGESTETAAIPRTVQIQVGNYVFTATGDIPESAEIQAVEIPADTAKQLTGRKNMLFAYDIRLVVDGQVWQPEDYGKDVQISVQDINDPLKSKDISILHVKTDILQEDGSLSEEALKKAVEDLPEGNVESEKIATGASDGVVSFETTSFSPFLAAQATLQEIFDRALASSIKEGKASGTLQIELEAETEYEGDTVLEVNSETATVGDDFRVDIVAPNAGSDNLQADGSTVLSGNVTIRGIKVRMVGITIAAGKKITVANNDKNKGNLDFYGTAEADELTVDVKKDAEARIVTGAGDDKVTTNVQEGLATVNTGDGKDSVTADVNGGKLAVNTGAGDDSVSATVMGGTADIQTGEDNDAVTANLTGGTATVRTDEGNDRVTAKVSGNEAESTLNVEANAGDDTVSVTNDSLKSKVTISAGDGDDAVEVDARAAVDNYGKGQAGGNSDNNPGISINAGTGDDTVTLKNNGGGRTVKGTINVELGAGNDTANVDTSLSTVVDKVNVKGHKDSRDTLHITGTLATWEDKQPNPVTVTDIRNGYEPLTVEEIKNIKMKTSSGSDLNIDLSEINSLTDSLGNKKTIELTKDDVNNKTYEAEHPFVNYHVNFPAKDIQNLTIKSKNNKYLPLSNLLINTASDGVLTIDKDAVINVRGMNLTLNSDKIDVKGKLLANTVVLNADVGNNKINVQRESRINIADTGKIYSAGDVSIQAKTSMVGPMIDINGMIGGAQETISTITDAVGLGDFDPNSTAYLNFVNVKLAKASVEIAGKVYAGVPESKLDDIAQTLSNNSSENPDVTSFEDGHGSVNVKAETSVIMGKSDGTPVNVGFPVGVSVANVEAKVTIKENAVIKAAQDVSIASKSTLKAGTRASTGLPGISTPVPVAVAVAVLMNNVHTTVNGKVNAVKGDAKISADGTLEAATWADQGSGQSLLSGGYGAVTVALQDVSAVVKSGASVTAGGNVTVYSSAVEKVDDKAASSSLGSGKSGDGLLKTVGGWLVSLKNWLVSKFKGDTPFEKKIQNALKLLPVSNRSVILDNKAQAKGQASVEDADNSQKIKLTVKPWEGYKVKSVTVRGYLSGESSWKAKTWTWQEVVDQKFLLDLQATNNIIYVEYEEKQDQSEDAWQPSDLFGEDNKSGSTDDDDDDPDVWRPSDIFNLDDVMGSVQDGTNGAKDATGEDTAELHLSSGVLTYDFLPGSPDKNLDKVKPGEALRVIPNPSSTQKLSKLEAKYFVKEKEEKDGKEEEKEVEKTVEITRDAQGRYIFNVPETFLTNKGVNISANYENVAAGTSGNTTQTQVNGTVAVTVARNDSQALIESGATVEAGGAVDVSSETRTDVNTYADGSSASKPGSGGGSPAPAAAPTYPISRAENDDADGYLNDQYMYGLKVGEIINGDVKVTQATDPYTYVFTPVKKTYDGAEYEVTGATLTYFQGGEPKTVTLKKGSDGNYTVKLEQSVTGTILDYYTLSDDCYNKPEISTFNSIINFGAELFGNKLGIDKGSMLTVNFTFGSKTENDTVHEVTSERIEVPYLINIKYNKRKDEQNAIEYTTDGTGDDMKFVFTATADTKNSYSLKDDKLKVSWDGGSTELKKNENGKWELKASDLPKGVKVTVSGEFVEDLHEFKTKDGIKDGTVTLYDEKIKKADAPKFKVKPNENYSVQTITVTYTNTSDQKVTLNLKANEITKAKDGDNKEIKDVYTFTAPGMKEGTEVLVDASFVLKTIGLYKGQNTEKEKYQIYVNDELVALDGTANVTHGDSVSVKLDDAFVHAGQKITAVKAEVDGKTVTINVKNGSFTVPSGDDIGDTDKIKISEVKIVDKDIGLDMDGVKLNHGSVTPSVPRADRNEKVTVTVMPDEPNSYKIKADTLKAVFSVGNYKEEVKLNRGESDYVYFFTIPNMQGVSDAELNKVKVTFVGEFEPGQSSSTLFNTSVGAGIAVSVVNSEGSADVKGTATGAEVNVNSVSGGKVATESKAGFSAGNTGVSGAVSVQVASVDSKALVHKDAELKGGLNVTASNTLDYAVNADASGNKTAKKTGVGAGIAVAVNGADAYAAVNDGAKLSGPITGINVMANQSLKDALHAKAGASGGKTGVPVAVVDVTGGSVQAYLGKLNNGQKLTDIEVVTISAVNSASHELSADASAAGKNVAVGAAINVSVISDKANARLKQSVGAGAVTVNTETESLLTNTATAGVSGGLGADNGGKSPDQQADGLLGMAAGLIGKNGSDGISGKDLEGAMSENRQKAETSEGSVNVAGAVAVNVQKSVSNSEILSGVNVNAADALNVTSLNVTTAKVQANASTTKSNIGVGVGVAVNVVNLQNLASISDGEIEAAMLTVAAKTKTTDPKAIAEAQAKAAAEAEAAALAAMTPQEKLAAKQAAKAEAEVLAKQEAKKTLSREVGQAVNGFVQDLIRTIGLDKTVSASLLGDITNKVSENATQAFLEGMELEKTLGTMTFDQIYEKAKATVVAAVKELYSVPAEMKEPIRAAIKKNASLSEEQLNALMDKIDEQYMAEVESRFTTDDLSQTLFMSAEEGLENYLVENVGGILSGLFTGKDSNMLSTLTKQAGEQIAASVSGQLQQILGEAVQKAVIEKVTSDLPEVNAETIMADAFTQESGSENDPMKKASDGTAQKVANVFGEKMPYEDMLKKLTSVEFKTQITDSLRAAAKNALVTLSNESLNALSEHFNLALEKTEAPVTGHIIDTQAISGAGAKSVGVAGSVAVTVLNAETSATIAGSNQKVAVSGDMTVEADELRSVNNVASAAVNGDGTAAANLGAGVTESAQTGGGDEANSIASNEYGNDKKETVKLTVGVGGTAQILQGDKPQNRPNAYIHLKEGYKLPEGNVVNYIITREDGSQTKGSVAAKEDASKGWYVSTKEINAGENDVIALEVKPEEVLHAVNTPKVSGNENADAVSVSVKNRTPNNGAIKARVGELVEISVNKEKSVGKKVNAITYTQNNKNYKVMLDPTDTSDNLVHALISENEKEWTYTITMPDGDISNLQLSFVAAEQEEEAPSATDNTGRSVGVGAAFSMTYGNSKVTADIGRRNVTTGALSVNADSSHMETIASAAGTDPLGKDADPKGKDIAVDASVALNILDNTILAQVAKDATVRTTGYSAKVTGEDGKESKVAKAGDLKVTANETAVDTTIASAFSVGDSTAVGASVAVNVAQSSANALLEGEVAVAGSATVTSAGTSADVTRAVASALGADIARGMAKLNMGAQSVADGANKLLNGSAADNFLKSKDKPSGTDTNKKINERLTGVKAENGQEADESLSVSQNLLRSQGTETQSENAGSEGTKEGLKEIKENAENTEGLNADVGTKPSTKIQVGAAVGVTVTNHQMETRVGTIRAGGGITASAANTGNFNTQGTGAAMSFADAANSIAVGVAVSVNSNKANVKVDGDLISRSGDVTAAAALNQNLTGDFAGKLATQAISGSAAGEGSKISLGGAVSVLTSKGEATVDITGGSGTTRKIQGGNVVIEATDKSRLASRAGGISLSGGSSVGMGIASNVVTSANTVTAKVGNNAEITANSFTLNAKKQEVTAADFKQLINLRTLVTDSSKLTDEERANAKTGLIDYHKTKDANGKDSYQASVNLSTDKLLDLVDGLNFLSGQNTYVEAIAGSVATGETKANVTGSIAVAVNKNDIQATMGNNVTVKARRGNANVTASNGATTRVIAGSLSAAPTTVSVGATVAVLVNNDSAIAKTGDNLKVSAAGNATHTAEQTGNTQLFTGMMGVATDDGNAVGGAINVIVNKSKAHSLIGNKASVTAGGDADIHSSTKLDLTLISGSVNVGTGKAAAGGVVNVIVDRGESLTHLGDGAAVTGGKNVSLTSESSTSMISGIVSASVAASMSGGSGAGAVNVIVSRSVADTTVGGSVNLTAKAGDLKLNANNDAWTLNATLAAAGSGGVAIGGAFNVNVLNRQATVNLSDGELNAGGNLYAQSSGRDSNIIAGLAVAGGISKMSLSGNVDVLVEKNIINTKIAKDVTATASNNAVLEAYFSDYTVTAAGSIALNGTGVPVGATVLTVVKNNDVQTLLGQSTVNAHAQGKNVQSLNGTDTAGLYVGANAAETQILGAAGIAGGLGSATVNGVVDVLVNNNKVIVDAQRATLKSHLVTPVKTGERLIHDRIPIRYTMTVSRYNQWVGRYIDEVVSGNTNVTWAQLEFYLKQKDGAIKIDDGSNLTISSLDQYKKLNAQGYWRRFSHTEDIVREDHSGGSVTIQATDDTKQTLLAGGVSVSAGAGVGASVVTLVSNKTVQALTRDLDAQKDVAVNADNRDEIMTIAASAGGGNVAVQAGVTVQVLKSKAHAFVSGSVNAQEGGVRVGAINDAKLNSLAGAVAAAGVAAVTPVAVVTYFTGEAIADLNKGSKVTVNKDISVTAQANKEINLYSAGATASGTVGVSGTGNVIVSKDKTQSLMGADITMNKENKLDVTAASDYKLRSASGVIAVSGVAGVGVNAVVSVLKSNVTAELSGSVDTAGTVNVLANSKREVLSMGASVGVGGGAGVGVNVMVLVAGEKMSQDAADMLTYGNAEKKTEENKTFDPKKVLARNGRALQNTGLSGEVLSADLEGNGHYESKTKVGGSEEENQVSRFDGASGYRSADFDNANFNQNGSTMQGENLQAKDTRDVAAAKKLNVVEYRSEEPDDALIARITDSAKVRARKVAVKATQAVAADLVGAALAGGTAGVGISTSVVVQRSQVLASSTGTIAYDGGDWSTQRSDQFGMDVTAESIGGTMSNDSTAADRDSSVKKMFDKVNFVSNPAIRAIGGSVGAGVAGVAVGVGVVYTDNITQAVLGGRVGTYGSINVNAKHDYGTVVAGTGAVSGGGVGVSASVAVAQSNGTVKALIRRGAKVETILSDKEINVTTDSTVNVDAIAASAAVGGVGVNAGVAVAINRLNQTTGIEAGTYISGKVNVTGTMHSTSANSTLLSAGLGGVAVGLSAAVSDVSANMNTFVGQMMGKEAGDTSSTTPPAVIRAGGKNVTVKNDIKSSSSRPLLVSASAGAISVAGNVLLAFNQTKAEALVENGDITAKNLDVIGNLAAEAVSDLTNLQVGASAIGISVNYADLAAENRASVNNSTVNLSNALRILTNEHNEATKASAHTMAGSLSGFNVGMNAAVARNRTKNYATVIGDKQMTINGTTTIHGKGKSSADADFTGLSLSAVEIAASVVVAMNDADARTTVVHNGLKANGGLTLDVTQDAATTANATTGGGSLVSAKVNVVLAYGRTHSRVDAAIAGGGNYAFLNSTNTAKDVAKSTIQNASFSLLTAAAMAGGAYSQDVFSTMIQLTGGDYTIRKDANVLLNYDLNTSADVNPSAAGVNASLGNLAVNLALAKNTATAGADFEISIPKAKSVVKGNVNVITTGSDEVSARVRTAELSVSGLSAGGNVARADLSANQSAVMRAGGVVDIEGGLTVNSLAKKALANALIGANTAGKAGLNISLIGAGVSVAMANENLTNTAGVRGAAFGTQKVLAEVDMGDYVMETITEPDYDLIMSVTYKTKDGLASIETKGTDIEAKKQLLKRYEELEGTGKLSSQVKEMIAEHQFVKNYSMHLRGNLDTTTWTAAGDLRYPFLAMLPAKDGQLMLWTMAQGRPFNYLTPDANPNMLLSVYDYYSNSGTVHLTGLLDHFSNSDKDRGNEYSYITWEKNRRVFAAVAEVEGIQNRDDRWKILQAFLAADEAKLEEYAVVAAVLKGEKIKAFDYETTNNYGTITRTEEVWKPNLVEMEVEKAVFDTAKNFLTVKGDANIVAGMADDARSQAIARTNGAKNIGIMSLGSLDATATSTDNVSAIIEGANVNFHKALNVSATAETDAEATGFRSGSIGVATVDHSYVKARVGAPDDRQTVAVVVGKDVHLNGQDSGSSLTITSANHGKAVAQMDQSETSWSLGAFKIATQTTESWLDTLVTFGENTGAKAGNIAIVSQDTADGTSSVNSSSVGIGMNFDTMHGKNTMNQENNVDFGTSAKIESMGGKVLIAAVQNTKAFGETLNNGGGLITAGEARASNVVERVARINLADHVSMDARSSELSLQVLSGMGDSIVTNAHTSGAGLASVNVARAEAEVTSNAEIILGEEVKLESYKLTSLEAIATSRQNWHSKDVSDALSAILTKLIPNFSAGSANDNTPGIKTRGVTDAAGLVAVPNGVAHNTLNFNTYIGINRKPNKEGITYLNHSLGGEVNIFAGNRGLTIKADSLANGKGGFGVSNSTSNNEVYLQNAVWLDDAVLIDRSSSEKRVSILAANSDSSAESVQLIANSHAALSGLAGMVAPTSLNTATLVNQIRTNSVRDVFMPRNAVHTAGNPNEAVKTIEKADYDRWEIDLFFFVLTLTRAKVVDEHRVQTINRCDFCNAGHGVDVNPTGQDGISERYQAAFKRAIGAIDQVRLKASQFGVDTKANKALFLAKGLVPLTYLNTLVQGRQVTFKDRYGEEDLAAARKIYVADVEALLMNDVKLDNAYIQSHRIWTNNLTQKDVILLANATRIIRGSRLDYVSETLVADSEDNTERITIEVITALNDYAMEHPVIPVGSNGSLDFASGVLTLPARTDFEVYLKEISGKWLVDSLRSGFLRGMNVPTAEVSAYLQGSQAAENETVPTGALMETLTADGEMDGRKLYWIGNTPESASDDDQMLIGLLHNTETDEISAFRTSKAMMAAGAERINVSLFFFRDSRADRMGEEKYNILFYDAPEGENSLVRMITNVLGDRELEIPRNMRVKLRAFRIDNVDLPAYSLTDHFILLCDGTDGLVNLFDDFYIITFDGDTFDSRYLRIEGIKDDDLTVTLKKGQPIWPEKTDENHARDLNGIDYELMNNAWQEIQPEAV